jgi:hypothetical protein
MPDNVGERRECLIILEKVNWKDGLLSALSTDAEVSTYFRSLSEARALGGALPAHADPLVLFRPESLATSKISNADRNCIIKNYFEFC